MYLLEYESKEGYLNIQKILYHKSLKNACLAHEFEKKTFQTFKSLDLFIKNDKSCKTVVRITKLHGYN